MLESYKFDHFIPARLSLAVVDIFEGGEGRLHKRFYGWTGFHQFRFGVDTNGRPDWLAIKALTQKRPPSGPFIFFIKSRSFPCVRSSPILLRSQHYTARNKNNITKISHRWFDKASVDLDRIHLILFSRILLIFVTSSTSDSSVSKWIPTSFTGFYAIWMGFTVLFSRTRLDFLDCVKFSSVRGMVSKVDRRERMTTKKGWDEVKKKDRRKEKNVKERGKKGRKKMKRPETFPITVQ